MTNFKTLAAAAFVAASLSAPAFASDSSVTQTNTNAVEFYAAGQSGQRIVEGRNSAVEVRTADKARGAISQGFAPIDTHALSDGLNK
jgi:hypothetical protein